MPVIGIVAVLALVAGACSRGSGRGVGSGITGRWISCMGFNEEQGLGGFETWGHPDDVAAAQAAGTL